MNGKAAELTLIIGNYNYSSWSLRPWFYLRHNRIPFSVQRISLFTDTMRSALEQRFSNFKVPILLDGELEVWDSLAILEYLVERYPDRKGLPQHLADRAVARAVSAEMHSSFHVLRNSLPMNCRRRFPGFPLSQPVVKDIERIQAVWDRCRREFGAEGQWLFGKFSIADCMYAPVVLRLKSFDVPLSGVAREYAEHLYHTPAIAEWIEEGRAESEVIIEDEVDWPSEPL